MTINYKERGISQKSPTWKPKQGQSVGMAVHGDFHSLKTQVNRTRRTSFPIVPASEHSVPAAAPVRNCLGFKELKCSLLFPIPRRCFPTVISHSQMLRLNRPVHPSLFEQNQTSHFKHTEGFEGLWVNTVPQTERGRRRNGLFLTQPLQVLRPSLWARQLKLTIKKSETLEAGTMAVEERGSTSVVTEHAQSRSPHVCCSRWNENTKQFSIHYRHSVLSPSRWRNQTSQQLVRLEQRLHVWRSTGRSDWLSAID